MPSPHYVLAMRALFKSDSSGKICFTMKNASWRHRFPTLDWCVFGQDVWHWLVAVFIFASFTALAAFLFFHQAFATPEQQFSTYRSDLLAHIRYARNPDQQFHFPHRGFHYAVFFASQWGHVSMEAAAALVLTASAALMFTVLFYVLYREWMGQYGVVFIGILVSLLMTVTPIYAPFFNKNLYLGQGSPSIWHNPTTIVVEPFAVIGFALTVYLLSQSWTIRKTSLISLAACTLLISTFIKPNFVLVFIPSLAIFSVARSLWHRRWNDVFTAFVIAIPSVVLLIFQCIRLTASGGFAIDFLTVWRLFTPNVFVSLLLALAFPLAYAAFHWRDILRSDALFLSWMCVLVGIMQFGLLREVGERWSQANWGWGYCIALQLLFLYTVADFFGGISKGESSGKTWRLKWKEGITMLFLALHGMGGVFYFARFLAGGTYQ